MGIYENNNGINKHFRDDSKNASSFPKRRRRTSRRRTQKKGARRNSFCYFFIKKENIFKIDLVYKCTWIIICFIYSLLTKHSHTFFSLSFSLSFFLFSPVIIYNVLSFLFRLSSDDWVSRNVRIIFVCFLFSLLLLLLLLLLLSLPFLKLIRKEFFFFVFLKNRQTKFKMSTSFNWMHTVLSSWSLTSSQQQIVSFNSFTTWISFCPRVFFLLANYVAIH